MGVTTYYSVGGEIIGERSGGVRTDYLRDALGSVTATKRTDRGTISNTYRYKPYGERLAKTGVAADPRFQWVGTAGYRETAISHSKSYVRARHLGQEEGRWTTVDPLWPDESAYDYSMCSPTQNLDRTGKALFADFDAGPNATGKCGGACVNIHWALTNSDVFFDGWLVQHIVNEYGDTDCGSPPSPTVGECKPAEYWEAWKVEKGIFKGVRPNGSTFTSSIDYWSLVGTGECHQGGRSKKGYAQLMKVLPAGTWNLPNSSNSNACAGGLWSRNDRLPGWNDRAKGAVIRELKFEFACCCSSSMVPACPDGKRFDTVCKYNGATCMPKGVPSC